MSLNVELLESSFLQIKAQETECMTHFYTLLFAGLSRGQTAVCQDSYGEASQTTFQIARPCCRQSSPS
jgi:hypothetical protein